MPTTDPHTHLTASLEERLAQLRELVRTRPEEITPERVERMQQADLLLRDAVTLLMQA